MGCGSQIPVLHKNYDVSIKKQLTIVLGSEYRGSRDDVVKYRYVIEKQPRIGSIEMIDDTQGYLIYTPNRMGYDYFTYRKVTGGSVTTLPIAVQITVKD
jgi:hypothetical protein